MVLPVLRVGHQLRSEHASCSRDVLERHPDEARREDDCKRTSQLLIESDELLDSLAPVKPVAKQYASSDPSAFEGSISVLKSSLKPPEAAFWVEVVLLSPFVWVGGDLWTGRRWSSALSTLR